VELTCRQGFAAVPKSLDDLATGWMIQGVGHGVPLRHFEHSRSAFTKSGS
jgi:uncharacterized membrane protein YGL010W